MNGYILVRNYGRATNNAFQIGRGRGAMETCLQGINFATSTKS
jgi:hypothetical protein